MCVWRKLCRNVKDTKTTALLVELNLNGAEDKSKLRLNSHASSNGELGSVEHNEWFHVISAILSLQAFLQCVQMASSDADHSGLPPHI